MTIINRPVKPKTPNECIGIQKTSTVYSTKRFGHSISRIFQKFREINSFSNKSYCATVKKISFFVKPMWSYGVVNFIEILV